MKKLLVLVLVLAMTSLASATVAMTLVDNGDGTYGIDVTNGMTGAADQTGQYFAIIGVENGSLSMPTAILAILGTLSNANEGDVGDTGLFDYGTGTYGEFRATNITYVATPGGEWITGYTLLEGATVIDLYTMDNSMTQESLTLADEIIVPEPATIALLCLGGLLIRKK